jgi:hypothetical protein
MVITALLVLLDTGEERFQLLHSGPFRVPYATIASHMDVAFRERWKP